MILSGRSSGIYLWDEAESSLLVPERLIAEEQRRVGPVAVALWVSLRYLALREAPLADPVQRLAELTGLTPADVRRGLDSLERAGLLERTSRGWRLRSEPGQRERLDSPRPEGPAARTAAVPQAATQAPQDGLDLAAAAADEEAADLQAVVAIYHKWIGLLGEAQYERLRYWLETMGMGADVIAAAIRQAAIQAPRPRMSYVEGILRNWYNDGIRTLEDLVEQGQLADLADAGGKGRTGRGASPVPEGAANAAAYRPVDPEQVARWKELYPDEY